MAALGRIANGVAAIGGAGAFSQFPEFYQQYLQRLGGRLDQALVQEARIYEAAQSQGMTVAAYVARFAESSDPVFQAEGKVLAAALQDAEALREALVSLSSAGVFERPFLLMRDLVSSAISATFDAFVPAMPISTEGLTYAAIGMLAGLLLLTFGERCGRALKQRLHRRRLHRTYWG